MTHHFNKDMVDIMDNTTSVMYEDNSLMNGNISDTSVDFDFKTIRDSCFWFTVIITPIGLVGNILCLLVVSQKANRSISCSAYMGALSVTGLLVLLANAAQAFGEYVSVVRVSRWFCKATFHMLHTFTQCGSWIILALLLERVIAVTKPLQAKMLLNPKRSLIIIIAIVIVMAVLNIPLIFTYTIKTGRPMGSCVATRAVLPNLGSIYFTVFCFVMLFIAGGLPLLGILIMNLITVCVIKSPKRKKKQRRPHSSQKRRLAPASKTIALKLLPKKIIHMIRQIYRLSLNQLQVLHL